jgi:hypothetical protein
MKKTNYKVWHTLKVILEDGGSEQKRFEYSVESPEEGARLISYICSIENLIPDWVMEIGNWGMKVFENGAWKEWSTDVFNDIEDLVEFMEDEQ